MIYIQTGLTEQAMIYLEVTELICLGKMDPSSSTICYSAGTTLSDSYFLKQNFGLQDHNKLERVASLVATRTGKRPAC